MTTVPTPSIRDSLAIPGTWKEGTTVPIRRAGTRVAAASIGNQGP